MSSFLESTASLERSKVKQLIIDCPEQTNKFIGLFNPIQMNFLLEQGFLPSATIWEKVIEWSGREKHPTGIGADFIDPIKIGAMLLIFLGVFLVSKKPKNAI